ncbi:MAG TPA: DUF4062 domain-containing protein [Candidatus Aquilonibacter sp.]|nr:DUF4062 domain-containing protein [Candidatus Aquilonibacter sp.]
MKTSANRRIRVFVSSTFRDMAGERDALMTHAWPELRRFCRERQVELVEVDLRWGIAEEQSKRKETLKFCLDEIHACRPFFIGLLGERYGWTPGDDAFTLTCSKNSRGWPTFVAGASPNWKWCMASCVRKRCTSAPFFISVTQLTSINYHPRNVWISSAKIPKRRPNWKNLRPASETPKLSRSVICGKITPTRANSPIWFWKI